jgi:hypothetical protein
MNKPARALARRIADGYRRAYAGGTGLGDEWAGWEDEGASPES